MSARLVYLYMSTIRWTNRIDNKYPEFKFVRHLFSLFIIDRNSFHITTNYCDIFLNKTAVKLQNGETPTSER